MDILPEKRHELSVRGKYEDITLEDLLAFAAQNDIKNPAKYIDNGHFGRTLELLLH